MKKFEYNIISLQDEGFWAVEFDWEKLKEELNSLGAEGWEVVSAVDINTGHGRSRDVNILLKRELKKE
jgi:hypothetical protein